MWNILQINLCCFQCLTKVHSWVQQNFGWVRGRKWIADDGSSGWICHPNFKNDFTNFAFCTNQSCVQMLIGCTTVVSCYIKYFDSWFLIVSFHQDDPAVHEAVSALMGSPPTGAAAVTEASNIRGVDFSVWKEAGRSSKRMQKESVFYHTFVPTWIKMHQS